MMRAGASLTENRFFNNCGGKLFAKTGPILLDSNNIARQKLGRCRMLVVCGSEISHSMSAEIGAAEKRNLICTTLDGLAKIKEADENGGL